MTGLQNLLDQKAQEKEQKRIEVEKIKAEHTKKIDELVEDRKNEFLHLIEQIKNDVDVSFEFDGTELWVNLVTSGENKFRLGLPGVLVNGNFEDYMQDQRRIYWTGSGQIDSIHFVQVLVQYEGEKIPVKPVKRGETFTEKYADFGFCLSSPSDFVDTLVTILYEWRSHGTDDIAKERQALQEEEAIGW